MFAEDDVSEEILEPCGTPDHEDCGLRLILDRLGEKWTVMTVALTASGQSFARMVTHLVDWSRSHKDTIRLAQQDFDRQQVG